MPRSRKEGGKARRPAMSILLEEQTAGTCAGYVVSMWHLEDLLRAHGLDLGSRIRAVGETDGHGPGDQARGAGVVRRPRSDGCVRKDRTEGHLDEVKEVMEELRSIHDALIQRCPGPCAYVRAYLKVEQDIRAVQRQTGGSELDPIEAFSGRVPGVMLLKALGHRRSARPRPRREARIREFLELLSGHHRDLPRLPDISLN